MASFIRRRCRATALRHFCPIIRCGPRGSQLFSAGDTDRHALMEECGQFGARLGSFCNFVGFTPLSEARDPRRSGNCSATPRARCARRSASWPLSPSSATVARPGRGGHYAEYLTQYSEFMFAITAIPGRHGTAALTDMPEPPVEDGPVLVQTRAIGVCGTDAEIINGDYGWAPPGQERLIIGHESLGHVVEAAPETGFSPGNLVVGIVRLARPGAMPGVRGRRLGHVR